MTKHILHIATNTAAYPDISRPTGLWLSELTHAYNLFEAQGYQQQIISPAGGRVPIDPLSLKLSFADQATKKRLKDQHFMQLLENTQPPTAVNASDFDVIYFTGGHGVMWDFLDNSSLQKLTRDIYEQGGIVSSVCHGYCGLLNVRLSNGKYLIQDKKVTGFTWQEEYLAGVSKIVPYNAEAIAKQHGAHFSHAKLPFLPYITHDNRLICGQNPFSAHKTAETIIQQLQV